MADRSSFDLFEGLSQLGRRNPNWYDDLSAEGKKAAAPFVIARWMTGTSDQAQLVRLNTFVNPYIFALGQEKGLLFKLLAASATGRNTRYQWMKAPGAKQERLSLDVIKQFYGISTREAAGYKVDAASLLEMAEQLGWQEDDIKRLKKEIG